jgi:hypothetical protein
MSYFYNGINISNLIQGGISAVPGYSGFPQSTSPIYTSSGFDKPYNFSYIYNNTDVSNYSTAYYYASNSPSNSTGTIPLLIPNSSNVYFKSVSICCAGGGGGGGGAGGNGASFNGGDGGSGGDGSYAAVLNCPVSNIQNITYKIGNGGGGGAGNPTNAPNPIAPGSGGVKGGTTYVYLGPIGNIECSGGNFGNGGEGTPGIANGHNGNDGFAPPSTINFSTYTNAVTSAPGPSSTYYPPQPSSLCPHSGLGGGGGNASVAKATSNSGNPGNVGFILVYFSLN